MNTTVTLTYWQLVLLILVLDWASDLTTWAVRTAYRSWQRNRLGRAFKAYATAAAAAGQDPVAAAAPSQFMARLEEARKAQDSRNGQA